MCVCQFDVRLFAWTATAAYIILHNAIVSWSLNVPGDPYRPSALFLSSWHRRNGLIPCLAEFVSVNTKYLCYDFSTLRRLVQLESFLLEDRGLFILHIRNDIIKWKHFPRYWPFVWGYHRSAVNSPHKGQWRRALMFSLICVWINGWVNNGDAGHLRRHRARYDVTVIFNERIDDDLAAEKARASLVVILTLLLRDIAGPDGLTQHFIRLNW